jgi:hypothetical protein
MAPKNKKGFIRFKKGNEVTSPTTVSSGAVEIQNFENEFLYQDLTELSIPLLM